MSRNQYLKQLEREVASTRQVIDDLLRENYELKTLLKGSLQHNELRTQSTNISI